MANTCRHKRKSKLSNSKYQRKLPQYKLNHHTAAYYFLVGWHSDWINEVTGKQASNSCTMSWAILGFTD